MEPDPGEVARIVSGNHPHPAVIVWSAMQRTGQPDPDVAQAILEDLQRHYELVPR